MKTKSLITAVTFSNIIDKRNVLFVTTKNIDYIRNAQEIRILEKYSKNYQIIYSSKKGYVGRILEVWLKLMRYNMKHVEVVFIGFAPQLVLPFWYFKIRNKIIVIDFFISVYDTLIYDRKMFKNTGVFAKICHWIDSLTLMRADHIITDTKADAAYFIEEFEECEDKFETIYLEADSSIYYPRTQNKRVDLADKFVVLYFGSILPLQGVYIVLEALKLLEEYKDIYFQIIGQIPDKYNKPVQDNVEYIGWLSQEELAEYIANADLCLAGHFNGEIDKAKRTIPGKSYIYEMMQKDMILGDGVANHEIYIKDKKHQFVKMGDGKMLAKKIIDMKQLMADR